MKQTRGGHVAGRRRRAVLIGGFAAVLVATVAGITATAFAGGPSLQDDFEDGNADGWSKSGGSWSVVTDGSQAFQQSKVDSELAREFAGSSGWTDYTMQARVRPIAFADSVSVVGIAARSTSSTSFDRLVLLRDGAVQLQTVHSGAVTVVGAAALSVTPGQWYTLKIVESGTTVSGYVDGALIATGRSQDSKGRVGLQTFHATASFDDVEVTAGATTQPSTTTATTAATTGPTTTATKTATATAAPTPTSPAATTPPATTANALVGFGTGTTGGAGGPTVTVTSIAQLKTEAGSSGAKIIKVSGILTGTGSDQIVVTADKTIVGVGASSGLVGAGLFVKKTHNVIIQNLRISFVVASTDAIAVQYSDHVWIDHNELFSDTSHGKDYYDGLIDITHGSDYITVSWNKLHDHFKGSLVGHSDSNASEDTGHLRVTYHHNWFNNVGSRLPRLRFGTVHAFDNLFENADTSGIHCLMYSQCLIQNNVFHNVKLPVWTTEDSDADGFAVATGNDYGGQQPVITQVGTFTTPPYPYTLDATSTVTSIVTNGAGTGKI
jgi:pectate lyase